MNSTSVAVSASIPLNELMLCAEKESPKIRIFFLAACRALFCNAMCEPPNTTGASVIVSKYRAIELAYRRAEFLVKSYNLNHSLIAGFIVAPRSRTAL